MVHFLSDLAYRSFHVILEADHLLLVLESLPFLSIFEPYLPEQLNCVNRWHSVLSIFGKNQSS